MGVASQAASGIQVIAMCRLGPAGGAHSLQLRRREETYAEGAESAEFAEKRKPKTHPSQTGMGHPLTTGALCPN